MNQVFEADQTGSWEKCHISVWAAGIHLAVWTVPWDAGWRLTEPEDGEWGGVSGAPFPPALGE